MIDWKEILTRDGPSAWQTAWRVLRNRADTDECFQDACLAALEYSKTRPVRNWRSLLQRLAANRAIDRLRKRVRRNNHEANLIHDRPHASANTPLDQAENAELAERLRSAVAQLPQNQAEVFWLFCREGWSYREIADEMDVSQDLVGMWLARARRRLRDLLAPRPNSTEEVRSWTL